MFGRTLMWFVFLYSFSWCFCKSLRSGSTGCNSSDPSCLKCNLNGCVKCPDLILYPSRKCVLTCPFGYKEEWSTMTDVMGKVCVPKENLIIGISNYALTIIAGVFCGSFICFFIVTTAIIYVQYQRRKIERAQINSESSSDVDDKERKDFLKQLESLRPYAKTYLQMLNDTRKQLREQHSIGDLSATAAYRPVLRDLAKILLLLNRPVQKIAVPDDWEHLLTWAEQALKRYKRMSDISQHTQVAQLINFLQDPVVPNENGDYGRSSTNMSTFKPERGSLGSNLSLNQKTLGSNLLNPQWKFDDIIQNSQFNPTRWKSSKEYLNNPYFFDDDFCQLGFRPQDEITTEL